MKTRKAWLSCVVLCVLAAETGCIAPSRDWNGKWKLDASESTFKGEVLTISIAPGKDYHFDENSKNSIHCDGKARQAGNNRTIACEEGGGRALDVTVMENGVKTGVAHDEISTDGKTFTVTMSNLRTDEASVTSQTVYSRLSGSDGFAGQWLDTTFLNRHSEMSVTLDESRLHLDYPNAGQQIDAPLDGTESAIRGPHAVEETTFSARSAGRNKILVQTKRNGTVFTQGSLKLSDDGTIITESWTTPDRPSEESTLVYKKQ